jgi:hypothetical protein
MILTGDYRDDEQKKNGDETDLEPDEKDEAALKIGGTNPLAEEEKIEEDDTAGD